MSGSRQTAGWPALDGETAETPVIPTIERPSPVTTVAPRRLNNAMMFVLIVLTISVVGLLYLVQTSHVAGLGYEVSRLERQRMDVALENQRLTYEIARRQSLPAIEKMALDDLHMQPMDAHVYLTVPAPASEQLKLPSPQEGRTRSLGERLWDRLTGEAEANHPIEITP
ncbi:MAG TPA: hypothetical protein PLR44_04075 [Thermomicrobiales bacterium]|nr:hypothetical protein [Chloroflexota bacterium]HQZ89205.1 hypothetical protein [Thermomicrobiales bacterium]HRA32226.1 hypothetical protein [Thermomicrobiales bacterium]